MSGTNFPTGLAARKQYSGSTTATDNSRNNAQTKFIRRQAVIRCDAQTSETQTEFSFPTKAIVHDVYINVITVDATETVDIGTMGTSNDPNGFASLLSIATAGIVRPGVTVTAGGTETYYSAATRGALLATFLAGSNTATDVGTYVEFPCLTAGGDPVSYTCSAGSDTAVFDIIIDYTEVVTE